jgi:hypothetical protein
MAELKEGIKYKLKNGIHVVQLTAIQRDLYLVGRLPIDTKPPPRILELKKDDIIGVFVYKHTTAKQEVTSDGIPFQTGYTRYIFHNGGDIYNIFQYPFEYDQTPVLNAFQPVEGQEGGRTKKTKKTKKRKTCSRI